MIRRGDMIIGKYKSQSTGKIKYKVSLVLDWVPFRGAIQERKLYVFDLDKLSYIQNSYYENGTTFKQNYKCIWLFK